jgi:tRNA (guanine-N7-)-methyltransferase
VIELVPPTYFAPLDLLAIFGRIAPLDVDLGCGNGDLICELARQKPERNFLGIEKLASRVAKVCRKAAALENVRVLNVESSYAVRYLLPENSVDTFSLLFPDPWPKRRHHRRRVVTADFLRSVYRTLEPGGALRVATDHKDYFDQMQQVVGRLQLFTVTQPDCAVYPPSAFVTRYTEQGIEIHRLELRKVLLVQSLCVF